MGLCMVRGSGFRGREVANYLAVRICKDQRG